MNRRSEMIEFTSTRRALASLQRLLFCCQCSQLTKNVCTLGNCEHFFCKECVEERLGASCPVCETPAHARDAQVNRQLSNIVSVSLELDRVLQRKSECDEPNEDAEHKVLESTFTAPEFSHLKSSPHENSSPSKNSAHSSDHDAASPQNSTHDLQHQETHSPDTNGKRRHVRHLPQKVATRKARKDPYQNFEHSDKHQSEDTENEAFTTTLRSRNNVSQKGLSRQTRVRSKQRQSTSSRNQTVNVQENNLDKQMVVNQSFDDEETDTSLSTADNTSTTVSPLQLTTTPLRRGRCKVNSKDSSVKTTLEMENGSNMCFKTPSPLPSRRGRPKSRLNETTSSPHSPSQAPDDAVITTNVSHKSALRRRSAPVMETPNVSQRDRSVSKRRKSMSSTPSSARATRSSPVSISPATVKSIGRKTCGGNTGRVKRNAKGETPLHVAAIKGDIAAVRELLSKGDNPNVRDNAGWTPLHEAVNHGYTAVAEVLLQHGAMVNTPGMDNDTPLHDAVSNNRLDCVQLLMTYGASVAARNMHGKTALEMATTEDLRAALQQTAEKKSKIMELPQFEDAEEFLPLCFLGTALSRDQQCLLRRCATKLHAKVVEEYCPEVTHIVSSVNPDGQCPRTLKYLRGVLGGKWIVSIDWISVCLEYGEKVSEEPFEVPGSSTHPNSKASQKARINRRLQQPALFDGCQIYLHGSFTRMPPSKQDLADLLQLGGAHLLTREPRLTSLDEYDVTVPYHASPDSSLADCGIFIVHDGGSNAPVIEAHRMRSVPASWIVECIATFSLVEP